NVNGVQRTLVESWNGTRWSVVPSPNRGVRYNELHGVSCAPAATCTAAGSHGKNGRWTLIESQPASRKATTTPPLPQLAAAAPSALRKGPAWRWQGSRPDRGPRA